MSNHKTNKTLEMLRRNAMSRRVFIKKTGMLAVSAGVTPLFIGCEDEISPKFYFATLSDTHIYADDTKRSNQTMDITLEILNSYNPPIEFVIITGDLCDYVLEDTTYEETSLYKLQGYLERFNMPVYPCMGNHDYYDSEWPGWIKDESGRKARENLYVEKGILEAPYYKKEFNGVNFYMLNTHQADDEITWTPEVVGHFGREQIDWLKDELSDGVPSFLSFHVPLATELAAAASLVPFEVPRAESGLAKYNSYAMAGYTDPIYPEVLDVASSQIKGIFVGHTHWYYKEYYNNIPVIMTECFKSGRDFDDLSNPLRYLIYECEVGTGKFNVYNENMIVFNIEKEPSLTVLPT